MTQARRVRLVGPELEFWASLARNHLAVYDGSGKVMLDVSPGQGEAVVEPPCRTVSEALCHLKMMLSDQPTAQFLPFRPPGVPGSGQWLLEEKERVRVMRQALGMESGGSIHHVDAMTNAAAAHLGISGDFNPMGPDGLFLRNVFENVGPFYAARVHQEMGCGAGHLAIWRHYADPRRFPQWSRWLPRYTEFRNYFQSIPRLVGKRGGAFVPLPGGTQRLHNQLDHGFSWWLARPKPLPQKKWYLELRFLPSMPVEDFERHAELIVSAVEVLLDWFWGPNDGKPVMSRFDADPAIELLSLQFPGYFPPKRLSKREWKHHFVM